MTYSTLPDGRAVIDARLKVTYTADFTAEDGTTGRLTGHVEAQSGNITGTMTVDGEVLAQMGDVRHEFPLDSVDNVENLLALIVQLVRTASERPDTA